jgi:thiamine biosynthesis protein ThiI
MKFIVKLYPEIMMKSKSVRIRFTKMLETNIRSVLKNVDEDAKVQRSYDRILVKVPSDKPELCDVFAERLACIPGIAHVIRWMIIISKSYLNTVTKLPVKPFVYG